ncbi:hypothetical protein SAE02_78250 [Skermanella aerolata]|uniref:Uncharacterized protein n=1 Tax=Skermanella aerolata TaxID=393310 RepID=A0A512E4N7_9PROT|nr:hypothetical protein [Skermanella aerolata]KJB89955.1 hypothetical protein N826_08905 [Skermanella aerolata KACC 11604]GEO43677.1 hypothetical protein SAE02_78250 [Skermanella aerolata]
MVPVAFRSRVSGTGTGPRHPGAILDTLPVAVMTCDIATFRIDYANVESRKLLETIRHVLKIDPDWIVGSSIDVFHRKPEHQRRLLADPKNLPHDARITVGDRILNLSIDAVRNPRDQHTCVTLS